MSDGDGNNNDDDKGKGGESDSWLKDLPNGFQDAPFFKDAENPEQAIQRIADAANYMGNSIRIPGEDASDDARAEFAQKIKDKVPSLMFRPNEDKMDEFWGQLGRPEKADGYKYEAPEGRELPDDLKVFAELAHKHGLTQKQFEGMMAGILEPTWQQMDIDAGEKKKNLAALQEKWGAANDLNHTQVKNFLTLSDAPEGIQELFESGAMSPEEVLWIHSVAKSVKSDVELNSQPGGNSGNGPITPEEARERIQEMLNNRSHAYWNSSDPMHKDAIDKMVELQRYANAS